MATITKAHIGEVRELSQPETVGYTRHTDRATTTRNKEGKKRERSRRIDAKGSGSKKRMIQGVGIFSLWGSQKEVSKYKKTLRKIAREHTHIASKQD